MIASKAAAMEWATNRLIPFINESSKNLGAPVDRLILATLARRAAIKGISLDYLQEEVKKHYEHQVKFTKKSAH
jgi:hypothetical protein